jgi:hypothetical protein
MEPIEDYISRDVPPAGNFIVQLGVFQTVSVMSKLVPRFNDLATILNKSRWRIPACHA